MHRNILRTFICATTLSTLVGLGACASYDPYRDPYLNTKVGAATGAATGAAIGYGLDKKDGAALGAAAGAIVGGAVGHRADQHRRYQNNQGYYPQPPQGYNGYSTPNNQRDSYSDPYSSQQPYYYPDYR